MTAEIKALEAKIEKASASREFCKKRLDEAMKSGDRKKMNTAQYALTCAINDHIKLGFKMADLQMAERAFA